MHVVRSLVAVALLLVPAVASATPPKPVRPGRTARVAHPPRKACTKAPVEVVSGAETATFPLASCDGTASPLGQDELSILARPPSAPKPKIVLEKQERRPGPNLTPGIRRIDARLVERLEQAVEHFRKPGQPSRVMLVSGYRPRSSGSYHQSGRALDFRIDGVTNEALVAFCKTIPDTGCGYYPNSLFVHMDVRDPGAGHVAWIDVSKPGEPPKYVTAWPPPGDDASKLPALPADDQVTYDLKPPSPSSAARGHVYFF
ncbi:MAG TPA: DUF882 domain-containing protein [Polyangiaceae bacterium]|jgi:hypothetical protein